MRKFLCTFLPILTLTVLLSSCSWFGTAPETSEAATEPFKEAPIVVEPVSTITVSNPSLLVGLWRGAYEGDDAIMTFDAQGNVIIESYDDVQTGTYTLDLTTSPYHLDMNIQNWGTLATIIEFLDENTIRIENVFPFDERPSGFNDYLLLTRSAN